MRMNLLRVPSESIGYGRMGVNMEASLRDLGVDLFTTLPSNDEIRTLKTPDPICANAVWMSVPSHARGWWDGQALHVLTMWEATVLPESFRESMHEFETVMVPSEHNVELFSRYHDNVKLVLLGVDPEIWHPIDRPKAGAFFNFLVGGSGARKGTDLVHKAFRKVFQTWPKDGPIPKLMLKNPRNEDFSGDRVEVIAGRLSPEAEWDLYAQAHCYVQPSRGEGFGLQPLQAIAQGCPTILTNAHGHASFAHLGYGISAQLEKAAYFMYGDAGEWWEPDFDELCERMEFVYNNYDDCVQTAYNNAKIAVKQFTWRKSAEQLLDAIGRQKLYEPDIMPVKWREPTIKRFLTILNRDWACEIAGVAYRFERGKEYRETADVKRILFEADLLDPQCIFDDSGLLEDQLAKSGDYSAAHSYCPTCHQKLNTLPTQFDELMGEKPKLAVVR